MEDDSVVGDVDGSDCRLVEGLRADHHVLLQLDDLPRVQRWQGEVGWGVGGKLQGGLQIEQGGLQ